jgi:hypothetical protein
MDSVFNLHTSAVKVYGARYCTCNAQTLDGRKSDTAFNGAH